MAGRPGLSKVEIEKHCQNLRDSRGIVAVAARAAGLTYRGMSYLIGKYPELEEARNDGRAIILDMAEARVFDCIADHDDPEGLHTAKWALSKLGRDRGYGDKTDIDVTSAGQAIKQWIVIPPEPDAE